MIGLLPHILETCNKLPFPRFGLWVLCSFYKLILSHYISKISAHFFEANKRFSTLSSVLVLFQPYVTVMKWRFTAVYGYELICYGISAWTPWARRQPLSILWCMLRSPTPPLTVFISLDTLQWWQSANISHFTCNNNRNGWL